MPGPIELLRLREDSRYTYYDWKKEHGEEVNAVLREGVTRYFAAYLDVYAEDRIKHARTRDNDLYLNNVHDMLGLIALSHANARDNSDLILMLQGLQPLPGTKSIFLHWLYIAQTPLRYETPAEEETQYETYELARVTMRYLRRYRDRVWLIFDEIQYGSAVSVPYAAYTEECVFKTRDPEALKKLEELYNDTLLCYLQVEQGR